MVRASRVLGARLPDARLPVFVLVGGIVVIGIAAALLTFAGFVQAVVVAVLLFVVSAAVSRGLWFLRAMLSVRAAARRAVEEQQPRAYLVPRSLPPLPELLIGRSGELASLRDFVLGLPDDHEPAVVVIHGQPGVGRTTLALSVAHAVADRYPDGQIYASLESTELTTPGQDRLGALTEGLAVLVRALATPRLPLPNRLSERVTLYRRLAADKKLLVVLDDAPDEPALTGLLPGGRGSVAIITSTGPLHHVDRALELGIGPLAEQDALALLTEIVGRGVVEPGMARKLVQGCAHHPLAIRLVGIALTSYSGDDVNTAVERLVSSDHHGRPLPASALGGILDSAYSTLTVDEQTALRCLGTMNTPVFAPWMFAAASGVEDHTCNVLFDRLTRAQLVTKMSGTSLRSSLYRLSPAVLDYARERAAKEDNAVAPARRERLRAASQLRRRRPSLLTRADDLAESGRIDEAINVARDEVFRARDHDDQVLQVQANAALADFYTELGYVADAREAIDFVLASDDPLSSARTYRVCGKIAYRQRRLDDAKDDFDSALSAIRDLDVPDEVARIRGERAIGLAKARDYSAAHRDADAAVELCRSAGSLHLFRALHAKATVHLYAGDWDVARELLARARSLLGEEHVLSEAWARQAGARLELSAGRVDVAVEHATEGLELFVRMSHRYGTAHCRFMLGRAHAAREQRDLAIDEFREALTIFRDCGGDWIEGRTSLELAACHRSLGHHDTADRLEATAAEIFAALGDGDLAVRAARRLALPALRRRRRRDLDAVHY